MEEGRGAPFTSRISRSIAFMPGVAMRQPEMVKPL